MSTSETILIRCPQCGTNNRVSLGRLRLNLRPLCGQCKAVLPTSGSDSKPVTVTDASFDREVLQSPVPVLVDCWAPWCGPCRMVAPIVDQIAEEYAGRLKVAKLNTDENPGIASRYRIMSIPTLLIFQNSQVVDQIIGAVPKGQILARLQQIV